VEKGNDDYTDGSRQYPVGRKNIGDMIEQVLFTAPGEHVKRPDFGYGLVNLV
jgi:phage baseplate assembly protein W